MCNHCGCKGAETFKAECQQCDDSIKQDEINFAYLTGYGNATICDACVEKYQGFQRMDDYVRENWTSWKDWGEKKDYSRNQIVKNNISPRSIDKSGFIDTSEVVKWLKEKKIKRLKNLSIDKNLYNLIGFNDFETRKFND